MSARHKDKSKSKELDQLEEKKLRELQELARKSGLKPVTGLRKQTLIERLRKLASEQAEALSSFDREVSPLPGTYQDDFMAESDDSDGFTGGLYRKKDFSKYKKTSPATGTEDSPAKSSKKTGGPAPGTPGKEREEPKAKEPKLITSGEKAPTAGKPRISRPVRKKVKVAVDDEKQESPPTHKEPERPKKSGSESGHRAPVPSPQPDSKKKTVHDALPESRAETLSERLAEVEPKLGGFLINEGTLEILPDGYGFLRSVNYHYAASPDDIYVSPSQIKRFALKQGDSVIGVIRPPKIGERYFALLRVDGVNGRIPSNMDDRKDFDDLLPVYPDSRYVLEYRASDYTTRLIDLFSPIGKGQRGVIVAQPKTGKTTILRNIANAVAVNNPDTKIIILLIDERPEEVTEMERNVTSAEVVASTFDQRPENHIGLAEIIFEKAKRMVESGHDVLILMDSITRLARAYNICSNTGRTMSGGVDAEALKKPRKLFSSARNIEGGGSLTIVATALVDTGSRMDDVIFEEFKGTGNMELHLDRELSNKRIYPSLNFEKSGTRKEELLYHPDEMAKIHALRRAMKGVHSAEAMEMLITRVKKTKTNAEFLMGLNR